MTESSDSSFVYKAIFIGLVVILFVIIGLVIICILMIIVFIIYIIIRKTMTRCTKNIAKEISENTTINEENKTETIKPSRTRKKTTKEPEELNKSFSFLP